MRHLALLAVVVALLASGAASETWTSIARIVESPHPYPDGKVLEFPIAVEGARSIRVHLERIDLEEDYDILEVVDGRGRVVERLTGARRDFWTKEIAGSRAVLRLRADESMSFWGFRVDRFEVTRPAHGPGPAPVPEPVPQPGPALEPGSARPVARLECVPARITVPASGRAAIEVRGYDRHGRRVPADAIDVFWNVLGEGTVVRTDAPGRFEYRAPRTVARETTVTLRATDASQANVRAEATVVVRPRPPLTALAVVPEAGEVDAGGAIGLRIEGRTRVSKEIVSLVGWPLRVWLEGPGRLDPVHGVGLYRYIAPSDVRRPIRVVIRSALTEDPKVVGSTTIVVRRPIRLVGLKVVPSKRLLGPGEEVEIRVEGIGEPPDRPASLAGVEIGVSVEFAGQMRRPAREAAALSRDGDVWRWRAPPRMRRGRAEFLFRAAARNREGVTGEARVIVSRPITSLEIVPAQDRVPAGGTVEVKVFGRTADSGDRFEISPKSLRLRLDGPGEFSSNPDARGFHYAAPRDLRRPTRVTLRADLLDGRAVISGAAEITVRPRIRLKDVEIRPARTSVRPGEEIEIRVLAVGHRPGVPVLPTDVALALTARGGVLRAAGPGVWMWRAPADVAGRRAFRFRATARAEKELSRDLRLLVESAGAPATDPIEDDELIEIYEWRVQPAWPPSADWVVQKLPKGDLYKHPAKEMSFKGRILLAEVRSISVELTREGSDKVRTYVTDDNNLKLKKDEKRGWVFVFKKDFAHEGRKYTVRLLATTADGTVLRDSFRVVNKK